MSDIQLYLLEVERNKREALRIAEQSANKLASKQLKLIDLITSLEEYINNKNDEDVRARSVSYLADVLENVQARVLSGQERRLLCDFVLGRVEGDTVGIGASARALVALEERGKWDSTTAQRVMRTFMHHTHPLKQFKTQTERYSVVQLIDMLLLKYRDPIHELHKQDGEFMPGFISYFEGEKDPRNLMIVYSLLLVPMTEWDVRTHAQDLFEAVFNYFPITFKPPPDDPYGITAQDLKDRLKACIAANSDFAPYSFPALLDKLDSTSMNTKRDTLQTIQACAAGYEAKTINLYSVTLWDALKFEILNVQEESLAEEALQALTTIAVKFSKEQEGPLNAYLRPIMKECGEHLEDAPTKQSAAAARIIHAVAKASPNVASKLTKGVLPTLFTLYQSSESIAKRRGLLEVFNQLALAYLETQTMALDERPEAFQAFTEDALAAILRALATAPRAEVSFRLVALQGLSLLASITGVLSEKQTQGAIEAVCDVVLHEHIDGHGDIRSEAVTALVEMAKSVPAAIQSQAIPAFMVALPDMPASEESYASVLEAFTKLSVEQQVFDTVILRLKNKLNTARSNGSPTHYQQALLLAILYAFTFGSPLKEDGKLRSSYFTEFVEPLISLIREDAGMRDSSTMLEIIGRITNVILRPQSPHFQSTVYNKYIDWVSGSLDKSASTSEEHTHELAPFTLYYYAALRPEVAESNDVLSLLSSQSSRLLISERFVNNSTFAIRHLSLLVNKFLEPKLMETSLRDAGIGVESLLAKDANNDKVAIVFAVIKGLLIQGKSGPLTTKYIQLLMETLPKADHSFARRFSTLLSPDDSLTKENHCLVSGLHKQRIFNQIVPLIVSAVPSADSQVKPNYLVALSGILRWLPYTILQPSASSLLPPLLQSLDLGDYHVTAPTLEIFKSVLEENAEVAAEHVSSLVTRLLNCTAVTTQANSASVRARSLLCLALVPKKLKRESVVPYRRQVIKRLQACLDDGKRNVRAEAVRCRSAWLALDEGNDEET